MSITLAFLLLITSNITITIAQTPLNTEWPRNSDLNHNSSINDEYTIMANPALNTTAQTPYKWTPNNHSSPEEQHTTQIEAYTSTPENSNATDQRPIIIIGVLLLAGIVFAFTLLLTWYLIKQKAKSRRTASETDSASRVQASANKFFIQVPKKSISLIKEQKIKWLTKYKINQQQHTGYLL